MMDIKILMKGGGEGVCVCFFCILLYYFINVIIKTLYISNFIVIYVIYFTHSLYCYVLLCFSLLLKSYNFSTRNRSSRTVFDLEGWNKHHLIGNWMPYTWAIYMYIFICFQPKKIQNIEKYTSKFEKGEFFLKYFSKFYFSKILKTQSVTLCSKAF